MKIFGVGLSKTGTRSLISALQILGYKSLHYPWSYEDFDNHEALADISVSVRFKELDSLYPNSKFILTTRELSGWLVSCARKPKDFEEPPKWKLDTRIEMYGTKFYDREMYIKAYHRHHHEVLRHFSNYPERLLVLNLIEKPSWSPLCEFLNRPIPDVPFPHLGHRKKLVKFL